MTAVWQYLLSRKVLRGLSRGLAFALLFLAVPLLAYYAYARFAVPVVTLTNVVEGPVVQAFYATGTLLPDREYPVKSNVEGTVDAVFVDKGTVVTKGQKLATVYVEEFLLKRTQAEADLEFKQKLADEKTSPTLLEFDAKIHAADQQLEIARREFNRLAQLRDTGGRTMTEFDKADEAVKTLLNLITALKAAKANKQLEYERDIKFTQAAFDIAQYNVKQQTIVSPLDGVVLDWPVTIGTRVRENDLIMNVADVRFDHLVLRVNVDEEDITRVRLKQPVKISLYSYPERLFGGEVLKIYPKADSARRTFEIDVKIIAADPHFAAGMTGELAFIVDQKEQAIVVPSQAIQNGKAWTVRNHKLVELKVQTGLRSIQRTEIMAGLQPGDQVIVSPLGNMRAGREVRSTFLDPLIAAGLNEPKKETSHFSKF